MTWRVFGLWAVKMKWECSSKSNWIGPSLNNLFFFFTLVILPPASVKINPLGTDRLFWTVCWEAVRDTLCAHISTTKNCLQEEAGLLFEFSQACACRESLSPIGGWGWRETWNDPGWPSFNSPVCKSCLKPNIRLCFTWRPCHGMLHSALYCPNLARSQCLLDGNSTRPRAKLPEQDYKSHHQSNRQNAPDTLTCMSTKTI